MAKALIVMALVAGFVATVAVDDAAANGCTSGEICYWGEDSYTGCHYETQADDTNLSETWHNCTAKVDNGTNSFINNGASCNIMFYDYTQYRGGHKFAFRNGTGSWWFDVNLGNNTWSGSVSGSSGTVMEDDITSHNFCP